MLPQQKNAASMQAVKLSIFVSSDFQLPNFASNLYFFLQIAVSFDYKVTTVEDRPRLGRMPQHTNYLRHYRPACCTTKVAASPASSE